MPSARPSCRSIAPPAGRASRRDGPYGLFKAVWVPGRNFADCDDGALQERLVSGGLMESARASWWHSTFLRAAGAKIGRGVYFDTMSFSVSSHSRSRPVLEPLPLPIP